MSGAVSGAWSMSGDPCPRCGSTNTHIWSFFELRRQGVKLRSRKSRRGGSLGYQIQCHDCGCREDKRGLPGRELSERGPA
jgi:hypothetical protein